MTAMTFTHDDIRDRLVDYLYGQLDEQARAAFQAHLDTCAVCRDQVAGTERGRVVAREVVRRPLADAVPDRVRARAFEAARAAVAARGGLAPGQAKTVIAASSVGAPGEGWFGRLRRRWTWTFPTFATVAAMAVFLLVRATIFREAKSPVSEERARELAKPAAAPAPVPTSPPRRDQPPSFGLHAPKERAAIRDAEPQAEGLAGPSTDANEPRDDGTRARLRRAPSGGAHHRGSGAVGAPPSAASSGAGAAQPVLAAPLRKAAPQKTARPDADEIGKAASEEQERAAPKREFAAPPPPPARASAAAPSASAAAPSASAAAPSASPAAPSASAAAPALSVTKKGGAARNMDSEDDVEAAPAAEKRSEKKRKTAKDKAPIAPVAAPEPQLQELVGGAGPRAVDPALARASRAETLMTERHWNEAITIFRELLRRYPTHPAAPAWRQRLAAAQAALAADTGQLPSPPP